MASPKPVGKPSSLVDTRVIYCGDNLDQVRKPWTEHPSRWSMVG